jgi:hypothetical protein
MNKFSLPAVIAKSVRPRTPYQCHGHEKFLNEKKKKKKKERKKKKLNLNSSLPLYDP